jgi:glucose-1-phosphate cytidylyltransferase
VAAVQPPGRFGSLQLDGPVVSAFVEKPLGDGGFINGGFFVLNPSVLDLIDGDHSVWEGDVLARLIERHELAAFQHNGFWRPMDTLRDKSLLEELWNNGSAPWKTW